MSQKFFSFLAIALLTSCVAEYDCITYDDITDKWFEIEGIPYTLSNCYLLTPDGQVIERNQETSWNAGEWYLIDYCDTCVYKIGDDENTTIALISKEGECIEIDYNDKLKGLLCECTY